jgi:hypothetical protein
MLRKARKAWFAAAMMAALLAVPFGSAEAAGGGERGGLELWSRLLGWLSAKAGGVTAVWANDGSQIDPFGRAAAQADEGPAIDPFGRPAPVRRPPRFTGRIVCMLEP